MAGYYFWWGDTVGYRRNAANDGWVSAADGKTAHVFNDASTPTMGHDNTWLMANGYTDGAGCLLPEHDAATHYLGGPWRMPSEPEISSLANNCDRKWVQINGVNGYLVTGRGDYSNTSVFFPETGYGNGSGITSRTKYGYYACSYMDKTKDNDNYIKRAYYCYFNESTMYKRSETRDKGFVVRPVRSAQ